MAALRQTAARAERLPYPLRGPFVLLAERASELELGEDGDQTPQERLAQLCKRTFRVIDDMIGEAAKLTAAYDDAGVAPGENAADVGAVEPTMQRALHDIVDLAYISGWSLHRKRASLLDATAGHDAWKIASECSSAKRAILKSAVALERAIAAGAGVASDLLRIAAIDVERGLRTRALYRAFRADIRPADPPDERTIESRLRAATIGLTRVCEDRAFGELRFQDRVLFHQRRAAVALWMSQLRQPRAGVDLAAEGLRQWQDIAAFAECLRMINHRPELRDHDEREARAALESLAWHDDAAMLDDAALDALGSLLGRDDELDALLLSRSARRVGELRAALERLG